MPISFASNSLTAYYREQIGSLVQFSSTSYPGALSAETRAGPILLIGKWILCECPSSY